ncbi:prolyl oligopeptidase family serine peptidase [candidate division KSB1 bacterium]
MQSSGKRVNANLFCTFLFSVLVIVLSLSSLQAQLPVLTPEDYGKWERIGSGTLSPNGKWLAYTISRVNEENELRLRSVETRELTVIPYGSRPVFSNNGVWLAYSIGVSKEDREKLEEQKKPVRSKLGLLRLSDGEQIEIDEIASFSFSENGAYLVMRRYPAEGRESKGVDIVVRYLASEKDVNFGNVSEFAWQPDGNLLAMIIDAEGKAGNGVHAYDPETGILQVLDSESENYSGLVWRKDEDDLAVFREFTDETYDSENHVILVWYDLNKGSKMNVFDPRTEADFPAGTRIVNFRPLQWADNGESVYLGIKEWEKKPEEGGSPDDAPALQIWHSKDVHIIPEQQQRAERNRFEYYDAVWHINDNKFVQLGDELTETVRIQTDTDIVLGVDGTPYDFETAFGRPKSDVYMINAQTGEKQKLLSRNNNLYSVSPDGKNIVYLQENEYYVYNVGSEEHINLTKDISTSFVDNENDHPTELLRPYGFVDWAKDGKTFFVYSKYDIWQLSAGGSPGRKVTDGEAEKIIFRRVNLDREENNIDTKKPMYLSMRGEWSKNSGYARVVPGKEVEALVWEEASVSGLMKAKEADVYAITIQDFDDSPDYFITDEDFTDKKQITETNQFQKDYAWGRSELIDYMNHNGRKLQGALFYPADYQPGKKYPMITYIYEMRSQVVHNYMVPSERDYYNTCVFTHQGYFVLQPDIVFDPGNSGVSSVKTMEIAVKTVVDMGLVDEDRVGLVGHSWGGYQAAFAPTQTDIFAASVAGAGLTDFFSMYGMVFWSAGGLPETNHFEVGQERMVNPPWKDIDGFVRNSPVLHVENLNTPLLFEVGDNDRNVDWRQGIELYNTARRAGKQMVLLVYANEGHGLRQEKNQKDYHNRILKWFGHYLKDEPAEDWIENGIPYLEQQKRLKNWKK